MVNIRGSGCREEEEQKEVVKLFSCFTGISSGVAAEEREAVPQGKHVGPGAGKLLESTFWISAT